MKRGTLDRQRQALTRGHTLRSRFPEERRNARAGACAPAHCEPRVGGGGGGLRAHERVAGEYLLLMGTRRIHCAAFGFCFTVTHMTRVLSLVLPCSTRGSRVVEL